MYLDPCNKILTEVFLQWVIKTGIGDLNMKYIQAIKKQYGKVGLSFSHQSNGISKGAIDALDGWRVCITQPQEITLYNALLMIANDHFGFPIHTSVNHMILIFKEKTNYTLFL